MVRAISHIIPLFWERKIEVREFPMYKRHYNAQCQQTLHYIHIWVWMKLLGVMCQYNQLRIMLFYVCWWLKPSDSTALSRGSLSIEYSRYFIFVAQSGPWQHLRHYITSLVFFSPQKYPFTKPETEADFTTP